MCESISSTFCIACFLAASSSFPPSIYASLPFWCVKYSRLSNPFWKMYKIHQHQNPTNLTWVGWCNPLRIRNQCWILNEKSIIVCLQLFFVYSFDQPEGVFYRRYTVKRYLKKKTLKTRCYNRSKTQKKNYRGCNFCKWDTCLTSADAASGFVNAVSADKARLPRNGGLVLDPTKNTNKKPKKKHLGLVKSPILMVFYQLCWENSTENSRRGGEVVKVFFSTRGVMKYDQTKQCTAFGEQITEKLQ